MFLGKKSKVRLTGMAAASATGKKLPKFVIGKSKILGSFKSVKQLPCQYRNQQKTWMSWEHFKEWMGDLDRTFRIQGRKVALLIILQPIHISRASATSA